MSLTGTGYTSKNLLPSTNSLSMGEGKQLKLPAAAQVPPYMIVSVSEVGKESRQSGFKSLHQLNIERRAALEEFCYSVSSKNHEDQAGVTLLVDDNEEEPNSSTSSLMLEDDDDSVKEQPPQVTKKLSRFAPPSNLIEPQAKLKAVSDSKFERDI